MSKERELLPCPFCDGDVEEKHRHNFNAVTCTTCHATVPQSGIGYGDAGKLWNRRAADRKLRRGDASPTGKLIDDLKKASEQIALAGHAGWGNLCNDAQAALAEAQAVVERVKLEAQIHAQETRTANATIAEIYQLCTGATGEPGNWHGAEPVRAALAAKDAEIADYKQCAADIERLSRDCAVAIDGADKAARQPSLSDISSILSGYARSLGMPVHEAIVEIEGLRNDALRSAIVAFGFMANMCPEELPDDSEELARWMEANAFHLLSNDMNPEDLFIKIIRAAIAKEKAK